MKCACLCEAKYNKKYKGKIYKNITNIKSWSTINIHVQYNIKYTINDQNFATFNLDISKQFLYMSCNAMEPPILGSHQIQLTKLNFSKHQKIIHFEFNTIRRLKGLVGKVIILYKIN